jgi:hypothetical protein
MSMNLNNVKNRLERLTCFTHREHPGVRIVGSKLQFECCCDNFKNKCLEETQRALANEAEKTISDTLDKAFKKFR